jgi:uncharacterized membrane protein
MNREAVAVPGGRSLAEIQGRDDVIVVALFNAMNGTGQWKAGHVGLTIAYWSSAVAGVALRICLTGGRLASWILPLTILLIAIGLVIMYFKERGLEEFPGRSYLGTNKKDEKYRSLAEMQTGYAGLGA